MDAEHFLTKGSPKKSVETPWDFKGYVFKIMGGCDKQGFPMKQGVLTPGRAKWRTQKSARGCIVSPDLSVLNLVIVKKGENDLPGLTDTENPRMRGPKRASKIRKLDNLSKEDDVRKEKGEQSSQNSETGNSVDSSKEES
ncbi:hypothetical protein K7X08_025641 [Anisodus acutangulus]|uniref:40S ribosomal protein S6 n=1 Tax=Anisodus acutangulus TaxID=402998 RepID=A0A9Q1R604_9SOLA|nr:hypothetical protein K7X08_025641 [Anisodus acutangulus]